MTQKARPDFVRSGEPGGPARDKVWDEGWDERGIGPLVKTLEDRDPDLRRSAALALGHIKDERVVAPLITALHDPDLEVRCWAVLGLGRVGDPAAVPALVKSLRETGDQGRVVADALALIGPPAIPALAETLRRPYPDIRCAAAAVLGRIADPRAIGPLVRALGAPEQRIRMAVATALAEAAANSPGPEVRAALPPLRRLARQEQAAFYRAVIARIERATAPTAYLPIPADGPVPPPTHLPVPADAPSPGREGLPMPAGQADPSDPNPTGWRRHLARLLRVRRAERP